MKFLVDAQLPRRLARTLRRLGHDALHTLDLPDGNRTSDPLLNDLSVRDQRVLVTKDSDFVDSFVLAGRPFKLLVVSTGNIANRELEEVFLRNLPAIIEALDTASYVELTRSLLIVHR